MNVFMFLTGVLQFAAGIMEGFRHNWLLCGVYLCYGVSAGLLSFVGGGK